MSLLKYSLFCSKGDIIITIALNNPPADMADHAVSDHKGKRQAAKSSEFSVTYKGCLDDERDTFPMDVVTHQG